MTTRTLSIAIAQLNMLVGDVRGNSDKIVQSATRARDEFGCDVVVFTELSITGYPPEDLVQRDDFMAAVQRAVTQVATRVAGIHVIIGHPHREHGAVYNAVSVLCDGTLAARYYKQALPNYGVFDEKRYFACGTEATVLKVGGLAVGITICEDLWEEEPLARALAGGAQLIINCNASPFYIGRATEREHFMTERARTAGVPIIYANQVGGQDELVFDGGSFVMDSDGRVCARLPYFEEALQCVRFTVEDNVPSRGDEHNKASVVRAHRAPLNSDASATPNANKTGAPGLLLTTTHAIAKIPSEEASAWRAITLGVRDYVRKNGFNGAVIGLSGGIDSALTLALAIDALGAESVEAVLMPSQHTRAMSVADAEKQCLNLGCAYCVLPIEKTYEAFLKTLDKRFAADDELRDAQQTPPPADTTLQNLQARCRGVLLMALSNKTGKILLTTGNKSELSVGYATLYGDMAGGFAVIKDVPKTFVYKLAAYRNQLSATPVIPERVITRAPSAELAPDQLDTDSLPPYPQLDAILAAYIEEERGVRDIIARGHEEEVVRRVVALVNRNEYKRRQAAPGVRITPKAFGRDRRYPLTARFAEHEV